jgi:hypothetical protein
VSSPLRPPKPYVITAMHPSSCGRAAAIPPPPPSSTRPVDPDVVLPHGDVIVSEGPGDEVLRGEDVVAHESASVNWTITSRLDWRGIDRQVSAGHQWLGAAAHLTVVVVRPRLAGCFCMDDVVHRIVYRVWRRGLEGGAG